MFLNVSVIKENNVQLFINKCDCRSENCPRLRNATTERAINSTSGGAAKKGPCGIGPSILHRTILIAKKEHKESTHIVHTAKIFPCGLFLA